MPNLHKFILPFFPQYLIITIVASIFLAAQVANHQGKVAAKIAAKATADSVAKAKAVK